MSAVFISDKNTSTKGYDKCTCNIYKYNFEL